MRLELGLALAALAAAPVAAQDLTMTERSRVGPWRIMEVKSTPGACSARVDGSKIDLILLLNNTDHVALMAGHRTWKGMQGEVSTTLTIGDGPPETVKATGLFTTVMTLLTDQQTAAAEKAKSLEWSVPAGKFKVNIDHFGQAVAAMKACAAKP